MSDIISNNNQNRSCLLLEKAIMELLEKNSFQKITVNDICKKAYVSRATFYTHYDDKYQLLSCAINNQKRNFFQVERDILEEKELTNILKSIHKHEKFFINIFVDDSRNEIYSIFSHSILDKISVRIKKDKAEADENLALYIAGGCSFILFWWMKKGYREPEEKLAKDLIFFINQSMNGSDLSN